LVYLQGIAIRGVNKVVSSLLNSVTIV